LAGISAGSYFDSGALRVGPAGTAKSLIMKTAKSATRPLVSTRLLHKINGHAVSTVLDVQAMVNEALGARPTLDDFEWRPRSSRR
jgi:hypothetical protein